MGCLNSTLWIESVVRFYHTIYLVLFSYTSLKDLARFLHKVNCKLSKIGVFHMIKAISNINSTNFSYQNSSETPESDWLVHAMLWGAIVLISADRIRLKITEWALWMKLSYINDLQRVSYKYTSKYWLKCQW